MKARKLLATLLALAMTLSMLSVGALAAENEETAPVSTLPADAAASWAADSIERWTATGIVKGDGAGNFNPDAQLTRGELAKIFEAMFGLTEKAANTFGDLNGSEWYADAILKCAAAGIMKGDGVNANAEANISRGETIVMFGRAVGVTPDEKPDLSKFTDGASVADWAAGYLAPLTKMGILSGSGDGTINAVGNIDRASVMSLLDKSVAEYVNAPGEYKVDDANKFVVVNMSAKEGEIVISGTTAGVTVSAGTAEGKIVAKDLKADTIKVDGAAALSVEGKSSVGEVVANNTGAITVAKGVTVDTLTANAPAKIENKGTMGTLASNTSGVVFDGNKPSKVEPAPGTDAPKDSTGKDVTEKPPVTGGGSSSTPDPDVVTLRPSGPAVGVVGNFDYAAEYAKAGISLSGNTAYDSITIRVDEAKLSAYLKDTENNKDGITALTHNIAEGPQAGNYIFVGLSYPMSGAKHIQIDAGEKIALTPDGESVVGGNYVTYYGVAKYETGKWVVSRDTTFAPKTFKWYNDDTATVSTEEAVTVKRTVTGVSVTDAAKLQEKLDDPTVSTIQINGTISSETPFVVNRAVTIKGGSVNGSFVVESDDVVFDGVTIQNAGGDAALAARNAINFYGDKITIKNCTFNSGSEFANGVVIFPKTANADYTITNNTFNGYKVGVGTGNSTTGLLITEGFGMSGKTFFSAGIQTQTSATLTSFAADEDIILNNSNKFNNCQNDYRRSSYAGGYKIFCSAQSANSDGLDLEYGVADSKFYVTGNVTIQKDETLKAGSELIIIAGKTLTIPTGVVLTNSGTLTVNGTLAAADYAAVDGLLSGNIKFAAGSTMTIAGNEIIGANTLKVEAGAVTISAYEDTLQRAGTEITIPSGATASIAGKCMDDNSFRIAKSDCITVAAGGTLNVDFNTEITGVLNVVGTAVIAEDIQVNVLAMVSKPGVLDVTGTLTNNGTIAVDGTLTNRGTLTNVGAGKVEITATGSLKEGAVDFINGTDPVISLGTDAKITISTVGAFSNFVLEGGAATVEKDYGCYQEDQMQIESGAELVIADGVEYYVSSGNTDGGVTTGFQVEDGGKVTVSPTAKVVIGGGAKVEFASGSILALAGKIAFADYWSDGVTLNSGAEMVYNSNGDTYTLTVDMLITAAADEGTLIGKDATTFVLQYEGKEYTADINSTDGTLTFTPVAP